MRRPLIAGNWKMHKTIAETTAFVGSLKARLTFVEHCDVVVAPPFTALRAAAEAAQGSLIRVAGQDLHWEREGAHTGEVSATMLLEAGASYVIIGHSERRRDHGETDEMVNRKLNAALTAGLTPIVCVGETLTEREAGQTRQVLDRQFERGLAGLTPSELSRVIIAYEPVWAIGTGRTATPEMAAESHRFLRELARRAFGETLAGGLRILYGGSVKPDNIAGLMSEPDIDGALVGGASLDIESFVAIVNYPSAQRAARAG
jgi:triosephosphate isomerase